jgi:spore germination protein YaaH
MPTRIKLLALISVLFSTLLINLGSDKPAEAAPPIPIRWGYYVNGKSYDSFMANVTNLDYLSPNFYRLSSQGTITGSNRPDVTNYARAKGVKVIPIIQNDPVKDDFNKILGDANKSTAIINTIDNLIYNNNFDGIHIDFEDLNSATETLLTNFMRDLYNRLHPKGKLVTMAVVARTVTSTSQFSAAYNYNALAPYLDLVTIMTYDFHYTGGPDGPVAPIDWQQRVLSYSVPKLGANKILLGIPFYGYDWNLTKRQSNPSTLAVSRTYDETMQLQKDNNGTFGYDTTAQTPYLDYTKDGDHHRVWFENVQSFQAKLDLMKSQQLRGFAVWRLGHEGAAFWPIIKSLSLPTAPVPSPGPDTSTRRYFSQTGHTLQGVFKKYWDKYGGLAQFGFPWTEEFQEASPSEPGKTFTVQYYERNRFEYHPEFAGTQYEVLLGLLGRQVTQGRENEPAFQRVSNPNQSGVNYYNETGHTLRGAFKTYWEQNGGLFIYGYPITEQFEEKNPADGKTYIVQYFERNRFEYHPENAGTKYEVLLGLLGNQIMTAKGWL